jgi:hypothetical protein
VSIHVGSEVWAGVAAEIEGDTALDLGWDGFDINWGFWLGKDMTLDEGVACLSKLMEQLSTHENVDPQQLQYKLIAALTGGGQ